jgi:tetratricopeptide (TPR) repeat protein
MEMDDVLYGKIEHLCEQADAQLDNEKIDEAISLYQKAIDIVPDPKRDWEASTWLYATIGDLYFLKEDYHKAVSCFYDAYNCPGGIENPFICLRLGEALLETSQIDKAKEFLLRAYMLEGEEIFTDEDKKYFQLIKDVV